MIGDQLIIGSRFNYNAILSVTTFPIFVIYENPLDYPGKFVARVWDLDKPTPFCAVRDSYRDIIATLPRNHMFRIPRDPRDEARIVESWV